MFWPLLFPSLPYQYFGSLGTAEAVIDFLNRPLGGRDYYWAPTFYPYVDSSYYYVPRLWRYPDYTWFSLSALESGISAEYYANMTRTWRDFQSRLSMIMSAPPLLA